MKTTPSAVYGAGTYTVSFVDSAGCTSNTATITLTKPAPLTIMVVKKNNQSCAGNDGLINVTRTGETGPYTFTLNPINITNSTGQFSGLPPGTYTVTVTDGKGCTATTPSTTVEPPPMNCPNGIAGNTLPGYNPKYNVVEAMKIIVTPNPTTTTFRLTVQSRSNEKVAIVVTDMYGKKVYQTSGAANQQYTFGSQLAAGMYIVKVMQGKEVQTIKAVKGN